MDHNHNIQQIKVGPDSVGNGDFILDIKGKVVDVRVECPATAGVNTLVGWNENAAKDVILPGSGKSYGVAERGFIGENTLHINFPAGAGQEALVTIWTEGNEVC